MNPSRWIGLGFVATIENAPADWMADIDGISAVAAQVAWGVDEAKPDLMPGYLASLIEMDLTPVGWAWCNETSRDGAAYEGNRHAVIAEDLGLKHFIANMEEPYDAHGDVNHPRFHMPDEYLSTFRDRCPDMELAVTTTPRWASNHAALREYGCVLMGQAFPLENQKTVAEVVQFGIDWGWRAEHLRPLCQVYETNGQVPLAKPYLDESAAAGVGLVPYILEQAIGGQGRDLLTALVPAIERAPATTNGGDDVAEPLPGLAADQCAEYEKRDLKRDDGRDATCWGDRAMGLKAMRERILELEDRLIQLEQR